MAKQFEGFSDDHRAFIAAQALFFVASTAPEELMKEGLDALYGRADVAGSQDAMMRLGLDLMFRQANPSAAVAQFRGLLARNPTHYGATYQLASALDRAGQPDQARPVWVKVLGMATQIKDEATIQTAKARLR